MQMIRLRTYRPEEMGSEHQPKVANADELVTARYVDGGKMGERYHRAVKKDAFGIRMIPRTVEAP